MITDKMKNTTLLIFALLFSTNLFGQEENKQLVRLAKLVIDSTQLKSYNTFLKGEIETSVKVEPGVLTLYAVAEKNRPTRTKSTSKHPTFSGIKTALRIW